jgi:hypothetical protein
MELLLFGWIVWQGEKIVYYEREVHRIQSDREKERAEWRQAKRKQAIKKAEPATTNQTSGPEIKS